MIEVSQLALALAFGFGCAAALGFIILRTIIGYVTREQYNVSDAPRRIRAIVLVRSKRLDERANRSRNGEPNGSPYLLPAAAPPNRFARIAESDDAPDGRVVELPKSFAGRTAQDGRGDGWGGNNWGGNNNDAA